VATRSFDTLSEREILALAISLEEEDERVYADYAERVRDDFPAAAAVLDGMREEESTHRARLLEQYRQRFGDHVPLIRRQDVRGFVERRSPWFVRSLGPEVIRRQAEAAEVESRRFYERAAARTSHPETRQLLDDLAQAERRHEARGCAGTGALDSWRARRRGAGPAPPVRAAGGAARPRRPDGRVGLDARVVVRGGTCDAPES